MNTQKVAAISLIILWVPQLIAANLERRPTGDPRVIEIHYVKWEQAGVAVVLGPSPPAGKIWIIEGAGIATKDGRQFEWMMQVAIINPSRTGGFWLVPLQRYPGTAGGTPTHAVHRRVILAEGHALAARCNGLKTDQSHQNIMALLFYGWEVDGSYLGSLLGLGSANATDSMSREILSLEAQRDALQQK